MSDESLIDEVRELLLLGADATPAKILEAARARRDFLKHQSAVGKKPQRDGAERELLKLKPFLPREDREDQPWQTDFEIACELIELEGQVAGGKPQRKHELRVRGTKLRTRIEAMPAGDLRDIRTARVADVMALLIGPDESELREIDVALDALKNRVPAVAAGGLEAATDEVATLRARITRLPEGTKRADFLRRHAQVATALEQRRDALEIETLGAALQAAAAKIPAIAAGGLEDVRVELDALRPTIERVRTPDARTTLLARHADALAALVTRGAQLEAEAVGAALQAVTAKIATVSAGQLAAVRAELDAIRPRVEKVSAAAGQAALQTKHREAAALLARRGDELEVAAVDETLQAIEGELDEDFVVREENVGGLTAPQLAGLRAKLDALRPRIEKISAGDRQAALQKRHQAAVTALNGRGELLDAAAVWVALKACAAKIDSLAAPQLEAARAELEAIRVRIEKTPAAAGQAGLQERFRVTLAALALRGEQLDGTTIEAALRACAEKIGGLAAAQLEAAQAELEAIRARIEKISAVLRPPLLARHQQAVAALEARRAALAGTELIAAAEACIAKSAAAAGPALEAVTKELQGFAERVAKLPPAPARTALEQKLQATLRACEERREIEAELAALEKALETSATADDFDTRANALGERIAKLPKSEAQKRLAERVDEILRRTRRTPPPLPLDRGEVLRLKPVGAKGAQIPWIGFVARSRFVLGRFPTATGAPVSADFSCPTSMKKISREHVVLQRSGREILAQEGPTVINGSWIAEQPLTKEKPTAVKLAPAQEIGLGFGPVLTVVAQHLPAAAPEGPPIAQRKAVSFRSAEPPNLLTGAVRFTPKPATERGPALVAWIFTDATIGSAATNAIVLAPDLPPTLGRVHYWDGAFWFENLVTPPVQFTAGQGGTPTPRALGPNEIVPLRSGDTLRLGSVAYTIEVKDWARTGLP